jgi:hypothetical protein
MENNDTFWMVYVVGKSSPVYMHKTEDEADEQAKFLSEKENKVAFVLKAISKFERKPNPVEKTKLK